MDVQECLCMLRDMKDVAFATVDEDGLPQSRIIDVMLVPLVLHRTRQRVLRAAHAFTPRGHNETRQRLEIRAAPRCGSPCRRCQPACVDRPHL